LAVYLCITVVFITGLFIYFGVDIRRLSEIEPGLLNRPKTARRIIEEANGISVNFISKRFKSLHELLRVSGREKSYGFYCRISAILAVCGAAAAILMGNVFLAPVLFLIGLFFPLLVAFVTATGYTRQRDREVQTALSIVTSSYMRTENLLQAVYENLPYIHEPVKSAFKELLAQNRFITSNVERALNSIKFLINNDTWREWCEAMVLCDHDRTNKYMLEPIISKLRNMESVQIKLDAQLHKPLRDFTTLLVMTVINFPILYFINRDWWNSLIYTIPGKIAITITFSALLYALFAAMKAVKPLEYKR
jgi:hypothetical protein